MDLDSLDAPMFVDFDMIKRGEEEGEGDEWFDKKIDDVDDDPFTNTSSSQTDKESKLTQLASPAQPVAREQPPVAREEPTEPKKEPSSDDPVKSALAIMASKPPPTRKRKSSERGAALKATASIHSMLKPQTNKSKLMTKDQYDQQKIEQIKKEAERQRDLSKKSFKMFKKRCAAGGHSSTVAPLKPKPPTQPVEFHFKTDERFKNTPTSHASSSNESPFPNNLRVTDKPEYIPNDPSERKPSTPKAPTKPKPFKFQTETRIRSRGITPPTDKYVSRAEFTQKYEKGTPPRFRTKRPRRSLSSERDYYSTRITVGVSPKLTARHRSRSPHVMSNAEKEERMMEEFKKNQFKARPIPPNLFKGNDYYQCTGVPQVSTLNKIPLTTPVSPNITKPAASKRDYWEEEKEQQPQEKKFKALPIPKDMFSSIRGVPVKRPAEVTVPQSPNITKKRKTVDDEDEPSSSPPVSAIKPLPMPKFTKPFQPTLTHSQSTIPQPFSFDNKYTSKDEVIEQLVQKEEEELAKKREFTARKMPEPAPPPTIIKTHQKTLPEPFALKTDELGEKKVAKFQEKVAELEKDREEKSKFKASDPSSLYSLPFIPAKSTKPLTETSNTFVLQTELRSELRSQFEFEKKLRDEERERTEEERKVIREAEEAVEIKALRRTLVHKAQPIHHYTPLSIVPSTKKLTEPSSPVMALKQRKENEGHDL